MDTNTTRFPWLKEVPLEMQIFVKSIDFFQALILLGSVIGMYRGIEINHPGMFEIFRFRLRYMTTEGIELYVLM